MQQRTLRSLTTILAVAGLITEVSLAAPPAVTNVQASQRSGTKLVDIYYDVADADGSPLTVWINVSGDGGTTWTIPASSVSGNVGSGITPGTGKHIVWNAGQDWDGQLVPNCKVRVFANDGTTPIAPAGMVFIPGGTFTQGDNLDNLTDAPTHSVLVDAFFIDQDEVTGNLWAIVKNWAANNGYSISVGNSKADNHPAQTMLWYDAVKWCNARSEKEGLTPVYYTDNLLTTVYRTGSLSISNDCVRWAANGYRLPTEAEWEKAARGGVTGNRFPWGNTITHSQANYFSSASYAYDISPTRGSHPTYATGGTPYTSPVGSFPANGYGVYDMAGNVSEWCWDWYSSTFYGIGSGNPRGPVTGTARVRRGGSWSSAALEVRCADRTASGPTSSGTAIGFRCVRGL